MKQTMRHNGKVAVDNRLGRSGFDDFLLAEVGTESNGMTLTVLSALSRLGLDPWNEAELLSTLPRPAAVELLAKDIETMPGSLWSRPDAAAIADLLVYLLPSGRAQTWSSSPAASRWNGALRNEETWRNSIPVHPSTDRISGQRAIRLTLLAVLLAGLAAHLARPAEPKSTNSSPALTTQAGLPFARPALPVPD
jgi:hypothetical protein